MGLARYPTWITPLCKGHDVDPVQVIFLKEERIKGSFQEKRNTNECVRDNNMEAGMEKGQGTEMDTEV